MRVCSHSGALIFTPPASELKRKKLQQEMEEEVSKVKELRKELEEEIRLLRESKE